jgi:hypothetical protein
MTLSFLLQYRCIIIHAQFHIGTNTMPASHATVLNRSPAGCTPISQACRGRRPPGCGCHGSPSGAPFPRLLGSGITVGKAERAGAPPRQTGDRRRNVRSSSRGVRHSLPEGTSFSLVNYIKLIFIEPEPVPSRARSSACCPSGRSAVSFVQDANPPFHSSLTRPEMAITLAGLGALPNPLHIATEVETDERRRLNKGASSHGCRRD